MTSAAADETVVSDATSPPTIQTTSLSASCRMLRSPSHESVTTDLSLFSVSSTASDAKGMRLLTLKPGDRLTRGPSPIPDCRQGNNRPPDIPEILWFEEENELIRSCAALSAALGLQRSFSTSDISQLPEPGDESPPSRGARCAVSELALNSAQRCGLLLDQHPHLNRASRSCSTWVAVGDVASTSQLPSPHGGQTQPTPSSATLSTATTAAQLQPVPPPPSFTAADLIRSVNKKVRQNYIRQRLLTTYKALERLTQSEFDLDRLEAAAASASSGGQSGTMHKTLLTVPGGPAAAVSAAAAASTPSSLSPTSTVLRVVKPRLTNRNLPLTIRDVERERGKPLSKYDRNMMIFNWLHTLDDDELEAGQQQQQQKLEQLEQQEQQEQQEQLQQQEQQEQQEL